MGDLLGQPRAGLARRFGTGLVLRLDQAMGVAPEPVSPARPAGSFAVRLTLPDPIGLEADVLAGIDRLLPRLCEALDARGAARAGCGCRVSSRSELQSVEVGLARPADHPERIRPLLEMKLGEIDAGFGIDMLRLEAVQRAAAHPISAAAYGGRRSEAAARANRRRAGRSDRAAGRAAWGWRRSRACIRRTATSPKRPQVLAAAWSAPPEGAGRSRAPPRPLLLWPPEPVMAPALPRCPRLPLARARSPDAGAPGPERIAPEWWLDDPNWRSGVRDYWVTDDRARASGCGCIYGHGGAMSSGWFCQGVFA